MMQDTPGSEHSVKETPPAVSLPKFLLLTGWVYLSMGVPVSAVIIGCIGADAGLVLFLFFVFLIAGQAVALIGWLLAKGSGWKKTKASLQTVGAVFGQLFGMLLGGSIGYACGNQIIAILLAIGFFLGGKIIGFRIGGWHMRFLVRKSPSPET
jgi:hypothetical protein